jgi:hypothetical protein
MFDYSQESSLDLQELSCETRGGADTHDISYASPNGARVSAYLVVPHGEGQFAGVIFLHGGEQDRSAFLDEALSLAKLGAVSLLIDEPSVRAFPFFAEPEADRERYIQAVLKVRRGLDLLLSRPDIDPKKNRLCWVEFWRVDGGYLIGRGESRENVCPDSRDAQHDRLLAFA